MTDSERIDQLEQQVAILGWLHNELVFELQTMISQLGPQLGPRKHNPMVIARAKRIAQMRQQNSVL